MQTFLRIHDSLLPFPERYELDLERKVLKKEKPCVIDQVVYYAQNFFQLTLALCFIPFAIGLECLSVRKVEKEGEKASEDLDFPWLPKMRGFATSLFQTSGFGTKYSAPYLEGKSDWDDWMEKPGHILAPSSFDKHRFFTDILSEPDFYIAMLKKHHVTAHRVSLEWSVFEPEEGVINEHAVALYRRFFQKLLENKITPFVTLCHFTIPDRIYQQGGFLSGKSIKAYLDYAKRAMDTFPEVKDWWSFNELGVKALQQTREVYPTDFPEGTCLKKRIHGAALSTLHMLVAHCMLHKRMESNRYGQKLGVTHQWLKFDTESGHLLEKMVAYLFTNFAFRPVYQFFKEGKFLFQVPLMANIQLKIPLEEFEKNHRFLDRIGVQMYPAPMIKMGPNYGKIYPGLDSAVKNFPFFSFGSTCEENGVVMRFGPRCCPDKVFEYLDEAFLLTDQVYVTEFGSDRMVQKWKDTKFHLDEEQQARYLSQLIDEMRRYSMLQKRTLQGIFCWSDLERQLEWENGHECRLGIVRVGVNNEKERKFNRFQMTLSSKILAQKYEGLDE